MICQYTLEELAAAVRESQTIAEVLRRLGAKGGGTRVIIQRKIVLLGLSTNHFRNGSGRTGRPRTRKSFTCKQCQHEVPLGKGAAPKVYCSAECVSLGLPRARFQAMADPIVREKIRGSQKENWNRNRDRRLKAHNDCRERMTEAVRRAAQEPALRAKRSENARKRMASDPAFAHKFREATKAARRQRVLEETCAFKPSVPLETRAQGLVMVRSKWERDFGIWLDRFGLEWTYEPLRVVVEGRPYTPDFFVQSPFGPCYVEVHRVSTAMPGDTKLAKMDAARSRLAHPLVLVAEDEILFIRRELRTKVPRCKGST